MKNIILVLCLFFGFILTTNAQLQFGVKAGINYNSNSIENVSEDIFSGAESKTGYHAGIWFRIKTPLLGLYIRPELVYTNLENNIVYNNSTETSYSFQKIDVPILLGKKIFNVGNIFIGPSFQYILDSDFDISNISDVKVDQFSVGLLLGAGVEFNKFGIDVRWERGFTDSESTFLENTSPVAFDTRVNQIIVSVSLQL